MDSKAKKRVSSVSNGKCGKIEIFSCFLCSRFREGPSYAVVERWIIIYELLQRGFINQEVEAYSHTVNPFHAFAF